MSELFYIAISFLLAINLVFRLRKLPPQYRNAKRAIYIICAVLLLGSFAFCLQPGMIRDVGVAGALTLGFIFGGISASVFGIIATSALFIYAKLKYVPPANP